MSRENETYEYGCLMVQLDIPNWDSLVGNMIDLDDVYDNEANEYGIENEPHVTILYGFEPHVNHETLKHYLMPAHYIEVKFKDISMFEQDEMDVLKFGCESSALESLHKTVKYYFDNNWEWPDYQPHVTITYLKPGTAKKYIKKLDNEFTLVPSKYKYTYSHGEKHYFDIPIVEGDSVTIK